jgi:hypothetical protein
MKKQANKEKALISNEALVQLAKAQNKKRLYDKFPNIEHISGRLVDGKRQLTIYVNDDDIQKLPKTVSVYLNEHTKLRVKTNMIVGNGINYCLETTTGTDGRLLPSIICNDNGFQWRQQFATENKCYKKGEKHQNGIKGIMVHSTGAPNPNLGRYVQPDDGNLGNWSQSPHFNTYQPGGLSKCVHAFIGLLNDKKTIATYQIMPWNMVSWHCGSGTKGSFYKEGYIGFEICEDGASESGYDREYFDKAYAEAVNLCAYLCKKYSIQPQKPYLIDHIEGYKLGKASNHSDTRHWFKVFGKTMDDFRSDVANKLN